MEAERTYTAFEGDARVCAGTLPEIVLTLKRRMGKASHGSALIFCDETGHTLDFDFHGSEKDVERRLELFVEGPAAGQAGPGRPRLGVVSREVSLLPRHWEWLAARPGGASAALRRLIDEARKKEGEGPTQKQLQERVYRFLSAAAGDRPRYEEALRALYRKDAAAFRETMREWPPDIRAYALKLARPVFGDR
jgi:uncharacterized protein